jgi:hypothetical protein
MPYITTINTSHLGDGAYVGLDSIYHQIWLGANDHRFMSVALGPSEVRALFDWIKRSAPHIAQEAGI